MVGRLNENGAGEKRGRTLLEKALANLEETAGIHARLLSDGPGASRKDAEARILFDPPMEPYRFVVKGDVTPARLGLVLSAVERLPRPRLVVAPYITPEVALRLRKAGVQFLDGAGNAYLEKEAPRILVWVTGNRPIKQELQEKPLTLFRAAGLRVMFTFLCLPNATDATYRELAGMAGVALGTVANTVEQMEHLGYLRKTKGHIAIENRERLMDAWVDAYPRELRPLLEPRRFRTAAGEWWKVADWTLLGAWLGGEPAAALMTKHLRAVVATVYAAGGMTELAKNLRLAKDPQGNVEILKKFWYFDLEGPPPGPRLVPPLLTYADLMATGDARNLETAAILRERFLG